MMTPLKANAPPRNANARRQPGERITLTNCLRSVAPVSPRIKLISFADEGRDISAERQQRKRAGNCAGSAHPFRAGGEMTGEEYMARLYCEPKAFWHCARQLETSGGYYTFNEINLPQYWLDMLAKYMQAQPSAAARQLHRRVEAARAEFKKKQDEASGDGRIPKDRNAYERIESKAWDKFNAQKQGYLKEYLEAVETGNVRRMPRRRKCGECEAAFVTGRAKYCQICTKKRNRESAWRYRRSKPRSRVISLPREIRP
jgi:hypothetical protein